MRRRRTLLVLMLLHGGASLLHFVHNAVYLDEYPNMPAWLTPLGVMAAWLVAAAPGVLGWWLYTRGLRVLGLAFVALFAALGYAGLDHYVVAPFSAHSAGMTATILAEVTTATLLLAFLVWRARPLPRS
jgi:hypothetical protein